MQLDDTEHPLALDDAADIVRDGGLDFEEAIGELTEVAVRLFDGVGKPGHVGASRKAEDVLFEEAALGNVRLFQRQFWGGNGASLIGGFAEKGGRPALLSIVAVDLSIAGDPPFDRLGAIAEALARCQKRCVDM